MSNKPTTNNNQEEIDLGYLLKEFNSFLKKCVKLLFEIISIFLKFKFLTIGALILLFVYGIYVDSNKLKAYENKVILIPNFESIDYLYTQSQALNQKKASQDTVYLKSVFGKNYKQFNKIEIEPFVDIYDFVSTSRENVEIFKVFAQNSDISEYIKDLTNSKYYKYHLLTFQSVGKSSSEEIKDSIISYLNSNTHFNEYKNLFQENTEFSLQSNQDMIHQIDSVITASYRLSLTATPNQSVFLNDNSNLNGLIHTKKMLVEDRQALLLKKNDENYVIKEVSSSFNLINTEILSIPSKIKFPLYFLLIFSGAFIVYKSFMKLKKISTSN